MLENTWDAEREVKGPPGTSGRQPGKMGKDQGKGGREDRMEHLRINTWQAGVDWRGGQGALTQGKTLARGCN